MNDIHVVNISYSAQNKTILTNVSFDVEHGETFALIGKNGSGKSTLIDLILEDLKACSGTSKLRQDKTKIGVLYDHLPLIASLKVNEIIKYYCTLFKLSYQKIATSFFTDFEISHLEQSFVRTLSLGEKKRISILLALLNNPELLILDEPFANIDPTITERIWKHLKRKERTIFFTTHNWADAEKRADKVAFMVGGKLIGTPLSPQRAIEKLPAQKKLVFSYNSKIEQALNGNEYYIHDGHIVCFFNQESSLLKIVSQHTLNFSIQDVDLTDVYLFHLKAKSND